MIKGLTIALSAFVVSILANLTSAWVQQDAESFLGSSRLTWMSLSIVIFSIFIFLLESPRALPLNWRWHRFWYLWENRRNVNQKENFASLHLAQGPRKVPGAQVIDKAQRDDLVRVLCDLVLGKRGTVRRALVLGEPGSGKTTGFLELNYVLSQMAVRRLGIGQLIPIFIRLGNFQRDQTLFSFLAEQIRSSTKGRSAKVMAGGIEELCEKGRIILLLDALDEALGERREVILSELKQYLGSPTFDKTVVVISARTREDPAGQLPDLQTFEIQDLDDKAVDMFIRIYGQGGQSRTLLDKYHLLGSKGLGRNPFWLRLILESDVLQGSRGSILNDAVDRLLGRELNKPRTTRSWRLVLPIEEQLRETKYAFQNRHMR